MKRFTPKVLTANALMGGGPVYLTADDRWSGRHADAELLTDEAHAELRLLEAEARQAEVVGPYLAEARPGPDGPEPVHIREVLRTTGPSRKALGAVG